jgi:2-polyprenyl-6-hydroxyphenyl methylase/3-demethylubiquinone-9 3-methyltransferase
MSTLNRTPKSYLLAIVMAEYVLRWIPKKTHDYSKFLKPSEISRILRESKRTLKELKGLSFNVLLGNWQLSDDIDVNYFAYIV